MTKWMPIEGFPSYVVSDQGDVANIKNYVPLATSKSYCNHTTYIRVTLFLNGVRHYKQVHRLVAEAFCPNPRGLPEVDHLDNDGENNKASNLSWVTRSENIKRSFQRNSEAKLAICSLGGQAGALTMQSIAEQKYKDMLGDRFLKFIPGGILIKNAAVRYICECGVTRTASVMFKELRAHRGKCPVCTNTVNRSSPSLE